MREIHSAHQLVKENQNRATKQYDRDERKMLPTLRTHCGQGLQAPAVGQTVRKLRDPQHWPFLILPLHVF